MFRNTSALRSLFFCGLLVGLVVVPGAIAHADTNDKAPAADVATFVDPAELQSDATPLDGGTAGEAVPEVSPETAGQPVADGEPLAADTADEGTPMTTGEIEAVLRDKASRPKESAAEQIDVDAIEGQPLAPGTGETASVDGASGPAALGAEPEANEYDVRYASIYPSWDQDWWYFFADGGESLTLTMDRTSGSLDSFLVLYDPYGRQIALNDDGNGNLNARISTVLPHVRGTYRVLAKSWAGQSSGGYVITEDLRERYAPPPPPPPEPYPGPPPSTELSGYGAIDPAWDTDDWTFDAVAGQHVEINMRRTWGGLDSFMELYNPYGYLSAVDDDSGGNFNARLVGTIGTTGRYTIRARSYNGSSVGGYALTVRLGW